MATLPELAGRRSRVPALPQALGVLDRVGVRQYAGGHRAIAEKLRAVFFGGDTQPDRTLLQRDGAVAHDAVKAEAGDVQDVRGGEAYHAALAGGIGVGQLAPAVAVYLHVVRKQRVQADDAVAPGAEDLAVRVAPQEQVGKHRFPPDEGGHLRVGFVVEQSLQRMLQRLDAALVGGLKHIEGQAGHSLGDDAHTGVDGGKLDGRARGDAFARYAAAKVKRRRGGDGVLRRSASAGLVPGTEESSEWVCHGVPPITGRFRFFCRGTPCTTAASFVHPRRVDDHHGAGRCGPRPWLA